MARTVTSTVRVRDALESALADEPRVDVLFAHDGSSAFSAGIPELLAESGARVLPWERLGDVDCDLIVTATENADLVENSTAPVLVLPHGVGFHKQVPDSRSAADRVSGVVPEQLLRSGRARLALSHPDQAAQLAALHPATVGRTLPVGDPAFDRLLAGRPLRDHYRRALGLRDGQRLVVLTSTWRTQSLWGQHPRLPGRFVAELPFDDWRSALVLHPNIQAWHGGWQLRNALSGARRAGLLAIPSAPSDGWQGALLAADVVVGDHGSVTFYAAALGIPVLLAAFGAEAVPETPLAELGRQAPRLDHSAPLLPQLRRACADADTEQLRKIGAGALAHPGESAARLRRAVYALLDLDEPPTRARVLAPEPAQAPLPAVRAHTVVTQRVPGSDLLTVVRYPAAVAPELPDSGGYTRHLACQEDERDHGLRQRASVLLAADPAPSTHHAAQWTERTLARFPGAFVAAASVCTPSNSARGAGTSATAGGGPLDCAPYTEATLLVTVRDRGTVTAHTVAPSEVPPGVPAAVVYALAREARAGGQARVRMHEVAGADGDEATDGPGGRSEEAAPYEGEPQYGSGEFTVHVQPWRS